MSETKQQKYLVIANAMRERIQRGTFRKGEPLPSENTLAKECGVSRVTVRQALAVLEQEGLIERQQGKGTFPRTGIRQYRKPQYHRIGLVTWDIEDYMFDPFIDSVTETMRAHDFAVELRRIKASFSGKRAVLQEFLRMELDGLLVEGLLTAIPTPNADVYNIFAQRGIPIVQTNGVHADVNTPSIITNDQKTVAALVDHLASLGHRKIGAIFNPIESQSIRRYEGYIEGLRRNGLTYHDDRVLFISLKDFDYVFDTMFYAHHHSIMECTALVCTNDIVARFLEATLLRAGTDVPERMSLTGLDDAFPQRPGQSLLTTATYPAHEIGQRAANMLLQMMETGMDVPSQVVDMALRIGNTTARPYK